MTDKKKPLIVLATDFSEEAERAYQPAIELAKKIGARIDVVHVVQTISAIPHGAAFAPPLEIGPFREELEAAARKQMDKTVRSIDVGDLAEGHVLHAENAALAICDHAEKQNAAYIALSTHGRTGLRRIVMGSIAEQILRHATTPLLVYPRP